MSELYNSIFYRQGRKERHQSAESLDVGYGKCPEFVCVNGLIVSKEQADWRGDEEEYMSSIVPFSVARGEKSATRARRTWLYEEVDGFYSSIFYRQGRKERHQSAESLDV